MLRYVMTLQLMIPALMKVNPPETGAVRAGCAIGAGWEGDGRADLTDYHRFKVLR